MTYRVIAMAALLGSASTLHAGGLDRSGQDIGILFEDGNRFEFSFGRVSPSIDGTDVRGGGDTGNIAQDFNVIGGGLKYQYSDQLSFAVVVDEPFGSDVLYPAVPSSPSYGGTQATVDSFAITALARYKFNDSFSMHGGLRYQEVDATVALQGAGYGPLSGYRADFDSDGAVGYVIGAAFEKPDIAMRVALTYNSKITHDLSTLETSNGAPINPAGRTDTEVETPESLNLEFQTGVAADTLVFGSIRYARYSDTIVSPDVFNVLTRGASLTSIEDSTDYEIGVGRRFNDQWSGSIAIGYQRANGDDQVSPLAPTDGARYVSLGAKYQATSQFDVSLGVRYTKLGDARATTQNTPQANFEDNSAVSVGVKFGYNF